jgi:hypothetical protein
VKTACRQIHGVQLEQVLNLAQGYAARLTSARRGEKLDPT